ncbi:MAG: ImmA/IrrE family metallo-endopeptidase [Micropruina sp.]|uniref:helix-turn-helix domain-containing protein n=1 Tax=Micropruina sp. TaxID=2737536 RepID=UPI0039E4EAD1
MRESKGWSQSELAGAVDATQGWISKIEAGLVPLVEPRLTAVAKALDCPVSLLVDDTPIQGLEVTCLHHRRRHSKIGVTGKRRIEALTHLTRLSVEGLLQGVELVPEAELQRMDLDEFGGDPAEAARTIRAAWRVPSGPISNVIALLEAVGIIVVTRSLFTDAQDAVSTWPRDLDRPPIMVVNTGLPADRQRFTTCHELGHLILHAVPGDDQEKQANEFAAEFLAPAEEIGPLLAGLTTRDFPRLIELKARWGMSISALIRRAFDLEIISDRQYRQFQIRLNQLGWRDVEPGGLEAEMPATLTRVMTLHLDEHDYDTADLAHAARMLPEPFTTLYHPPGVLPKRTKLKLVTP